MKQKYKGIAYIICSAFFFAVMNLFVHLSGDLPSIQKSFFRNLIAFISAFLIIIKNREGIHFYKDSIKYLILRSVFGTVGILCNFYAVDQLVLADASMLNKMSPFFAILFSYFILKERVSLFQGIMVMVAFVGSLFVIKPSFSNMDMLPALIGLLGGMSAGMAYTLVRKLGGMKVKGSFIVFFFSGFSCLITLPVTMLQFHSMTGMQQLCLLLAGLAATGGQFAITKAYCYAPAKEISIYDYSQIIFSSIFGYFIFAQIPDGYSIAGYVIIIMMAVIMFWHAQRKE